MSQSPAQPLVTPAARPSPLAVYFLLAFALTWGWQIPLFTGAIPRGPWVLLGPSAAGILVAGIADGPAGVMRLLKRVITWRVGLQWYAAALLLVPAIYLFNIVILPGGMAALGSAALGPIASRFAAVFLPAGISALMWEEIGWRGFALPRIQARLGPLGGTLLLGLLWGLWHLMLWAFDPSVLGAPRRALPGIAVTYGMFVCSVIAYSVYFAWILNQARGSVLLAVLLHASINATNGTFQAYFPAVRTVSVQATEILVAALIVVFTRLRLGYGDAGPEGPGS